MRAQGCSNSKDSVEAVQRTEEKKQEKREKSQSEGRRMVEKRRKRLYSGREERKLRRLAHLRPPDTKEGAKTTSHGSGHRAEWRKW
jgi:hypothetical protein